jgi:hypothetical protein
MHQRPPKRRLQRKATTRWTLMAYHDHLLVAFIEILAGAAKAVTSLESCLGRASEGICTCENGLAGLNIMLIRTGEP